MAIYEDVITFPSTDGKHTLIGKIYIPEDPIGIFHLVHGMCDHIGRYDSFLYTMCEHGYICVAYDNLGHGKTADVDGSFGFIAHKNGYNILADDVYSVSEAMKTRYPALPYYLMGHSMGSFIVRLAAYKHPKIADKLIVMGTGGPNPASGAALRVTKLIRTFRGEKRVSPAIERMAFASYNKNFGDGVEGDWLSKNPMVRKAFDADRFCNFHFTVSAMRDLIKLNALVNSRTWFSGIKKGLPILLISGSDDPVGDYSKGVIVVYNQLMQNGADVRIKIYGNNRHELLNDTAREECIGDILAFVRN